MEGNQLTLHHHLRFEIYTIEFKLLLKNMINKINKERRSSMNATPHMTQQQEPVARSPGGPQTKTGQGKDRARTS
jgi:flagellar hook-basal body complex protein FliE